MKHVESTGRKSSAARRTVMLCAVAALAVFSAAPEAHTATMAISGCEQEVNVNAVVTTDIVCTEIGIFVTAPGITIDMKGHTIRGDRGSGDWGIVANHQDGLTIKNGVIRNFEIGIVVIGDDLAISNIVATGNANDGINVTGQAKIKSSNLSGNGDDGFEGHGNGTSITKTDASDNVSSGVFVVADALSVSSVTAAGNQFGIAVNGDGAAIRSSVVTGNSDTGIFVAGNAASLKGNRAVGNGFVGGASDLAGFGTEVTSFSSSPPVGVNVALGNDNPNECSPATLC